MNLSADAILTLVAVPFVLISLASGWGCVYAGRRFSMLNAKVFAISFLGALSIGSLIGAVVVLFQTDFVRSI